MRIPRQTRDMNPRRYGNKAEDKIAARGKYRKTPGSGSGADKGDLLRGEWRIEHKATQADSYRITAELMAEIRNHGLTNSTKGALVITLGNGKSYAVLPLDLFEALTDADQIQSDEGHTGSAT